MDAGDVIVRAKPHDHVTHFRDHGEHALTQERFDLIIDFVQKCAI